LPAEVTGFVGRRRELALLADWLRSARLVTVTGPGGVGKTRVALRVAAQHRGRFANGVCLAELAGLRDPELLPHTVATCLGLPEQDTRTQLDALVDYLRGRQLLLILDGCEHLVDACAALATAVARETAQVIVLATSRQPLDIPGEHTCTVPPLPVPELGSSEAGSGDAVELFAQRAAAVVPGFAVTDANRADVIRLCRRLDGIPLAIELATVRLRAVPLEQLAGRLDDRFRLLTGERRAALPHHQTLRTATQWSYELCSPAEQLLWARLSVFAGSFDIPAAEQVCTGQPLARADILPTLIGLVDKSVVLRMEDEAEDTRYRLLDTIREFGADMLAEAGEETALRDRHMSRYVAMAEYFGSIPTSEDQLPRYRELRREHADIRAALDYAFTAAGKDTDAAHIATDLYGYWQISCLLSEGRYWMGKVLDRFPAPCPERAWALVMIGIVASFQGLIAEAITALDEGIPMADDLGDAVTCGRGYEHLTLALAIAGQHAEAATAGAMAEQRLAATGDTGGLLGLDAIMGYLHLLAGEPDRAIARCERGLDRLGTSSRERWMQGWLCLHRGLALFTLGEQEASTASVGRALEMKYELGDIVGIAWCLEILAWTAAGQHRFKRAALLLGAADPLWERAGSRLSGTAIMEELHLQAAKAASGSLGANCYAALHSKAAGTRLDQVVSLAVSDADELQTASTGGHGAGDGGLTSREHEIAVLVSDGLSNREIAERLVISKRTVDRHLEHILTKLGASSRVHIANWVGSGRLPPS
jgi:non-specific serine/threonine protein kinase